MPESFAGIPEASRRMQLVAWTPGRDIQKWSVLSARLRDMNAMCGVRATVWVLRVQVCSQKLGDMLSPNTALTTLAIICSPIAFRREGKLGLVGLADVREKSKHVWSSFVLLSLRIQQYLRSSPDGPQARPAASNGFRWPPGRTSLRLTPRLRLPF